MSQPVPTGSFDPYSKWLGIPPEEQPPNYYRLLGIDLFEDDRNVIEAAADERLARIKMLAHGPHGRESQEVLNAIAKAKVSLLKPRARQSYDARLRADLATPSTSITRTSNQNSDIAVTDNIESLTEITPVDYFDEAFLVARPRTRIRSNYWRSTRRQTIIRRLALANLGLGVVMVLALLFRSGGGTPIKPTPSGSLTQRDTRLLGTYVDTVLAQQGAERQDLAIAASRLASSEGWRDIELSGTANTGGMRHQEFTIRIEYHPQFKPSWRGGRLGNRPLVPPD